MPKSALHPKIEAVHRDAALLTSSLAMRDAHLARCAALSVKQAQAVVNSECEQVETAFRDLVAAVAEVLFDPVLGEQFKADEVQPPGRKKK